MNLIGDTLQQTRQAFRYLRARRNAKAAPKHYLCTEFAPSKSDCAALETCNPWLEFARSSDDPRAWLGLCADKHLLLHPDGCGLLFAKTRLFWVVFGGIMGRTSAQAAQSAVATNPAHSAQHANVTNLVESQTAASKSLLIEFLARARAARAEVVFYQTDSNLLDQLSALPEDFHAYKQGAEALIALGEFSLAGKTRSSARQVSRKLTEAGISFEVCTPDADLLRKCQSISEAWLAAKKTTEKGFSLGRFDPTYLQQTPLAVVKKGEELLAFANILPSADRSCLTVDLMRQSANAPSGCMDFLFAELMLWGKSQGYQRFSLGLSPLKDVAEDPHVHRVWPKLAARIARHGERFYNFSGVRRFKEKWQPDWQSRYILVPHRHLALPAMLCCTRLIAGSTRGILLPNK